jgi:hypothetical protein
VVCITLHKIVSFVYKSTGSSLPTCADEEFLHQHRTGWGSIFSDLCLDELYFINSLH